jgi:hypothetical protein
LASPGAPGFFQAFHEPTDALQSLASRRHPLRVLEPSLNPIIRNSQRLPGLIARWKQPSPTSHDLLIRPTIGDRLVEPKQHVEMIIHHREAADGD